MRSPGRPAGQFERKKRALLSVIEEHGGDDERGCPLSNKRLAEITGFSVAAVASYLMALKAENITTSEVTKVYLGSGNWEVWRVLRVNNPVPPPEIDEDREATGHPRWTKPSDRPRR